MTDITISVGESRRATRWVPKTISWERLVKRLSSPVRTQETVAEYAAMTKDQRGEVKDVGGYVGGRLEGGIRKAGSITDRQLICLDADYADMGLWDIWDIMVGKACLMHTSHSHTPEQPRLRFVIPLSRPVSAAEYEPIARMLAKLLDINAFDDTTYEASRLMFWPSVSKDGEFIVRVYDSAEWVDPDRVLAMYDDWHDMRSWPTSARQTSAITRMGKVQGDPLTKPGVVGAFNRAYTITDAINKFLPDIYTPGGPGRWTYTAGSTTNGAVTYDNDTFLYSHHSTDPTSNRLCNAFDLVRLHLYGDLDAGSDADIGNLPSVNAMKKLCQTDEKVRKELAEGVLQTPESVFDKKTDLEHFTGDLTEVGLSIVMADNYGYGVMRNKAFGWMFWDGVKWVLDADAEASMLMMRFTDDLYQAARMKMQIATDKVTQEQAKREFAAVCKLRTAPGLSHLTNILKSIANEPRTDSFDADPWALNTPDGIIDLRTGDIGPHDPKARCTKCTAVSPGSTGAEKWLDFIHYITGGDDDFANYLQTLAGMAAVGKVYEEGLVISYGKGGNGKSTFFGVLKAVFGDYARSINADVLVPTPGCRPDQSYIAALRGVRLSILGETEESAYMSNSQLKRITSQDVISARALYKDPMEFIPTHTTIMHTNHLPRLGSMDGGTKRRIAVAPFPSTLPPEQVVTDYKSVLFDECGPAIMRWVVDGAVKFYENGCKLPMAKCVKKATYDYLSGEDWLNTFIQDTCEVGDGLEAPAGELYQAYQVWAGANGMRQKRARDFALALEANDYQKIERNHRKFWKGLKIRSEV